MLLLPALFTGVILFAQNEGLSPKNSAAAGHELGITDETLINSLMLIVPGVGTTRADLERQSLKPYMMPPRQVAAEGGEWSYALASCLEFYINLEKNYKVNLSPEYISLNLQSLGKAPQAREALAFLAREGTVSAAIMPFGTTVISAGVYATPRFRLTNYLHIFREVTKPRQKVFEVRKALIRGNPVLVELEASPDLRTAAGAEEWHPGPGDVLSAPLLVIGYDQSKEAFELKSTWGHSWGKGGYLWISYDDFARLARNAYVMIPD